MGSSAVAEKDAGSGWEARIRELEARGIRAFLAGDQETLRRLWSEDLAVNSPLSRIHDGGQVLELLGRGTIQHESLEASIERIWRHGDVVFVMGRESVRDPAGAQPYERRFTNVWGLDAGAWRLLARHANRIAAA
jgi:ketosteroid isomerase-like protein